MVEKAKNDLFAKMEKDKIFDGRVGIRKVKFLSLKIDIRRVEHLEVRKVARGRLSEAEKSIY